MPRRPTDLSEEELTFLQERHLGTLTTLRADGSPHVVAIAFYYDADSRTVSIISSKRTQKVRNVERNSLAVVCQVDGRRWLSLGGTARVSDDPEDVKTAVAAFESRYRPVRENPSRVAIEIAVDQVLGRA